MRRRLAAAVAIALLVGGGLGLLIGRVQPAAPALAAASAAPSDSVGAASLLPSIAPSGTAPPTPAASLDLPTIGVSDAARLRPDLQAALDRIRARDAIPGVSATIVFADGSVWRGVSGLANVKAGTFVTPDTAFAIGSISKTFLAALILDLAEDGKLRLEDSAREYVPNVAIDPAITIRQLLDHTSGLHDFFFGRGIDRALRADRSALWTSTRTLRYVGKPYFRPGKGWHYSNTNYLILGLIAERVGGRSLAGQLRDRYFEPLGLDRTFYQGVEKPRGPVAHGYRFAGSKRTLPAIDLADGTEVTPFRSVVTAAGGAGSIASTSYDIARWADDLYDGGVLDGASLDLMVGDVSATAAYKARVPYGLGVQAIAVGGYPTLGHSGRLLGSQGVVRHFPDADLTIAVLTNQNRADPSRILSELFRLAAPIPRPIILPCAACTAP